MDLMSDMTEKENAEETNPGTRFMMLIEQLLSIKDKIIEDPDVAIEAVDEIIQNAKILTNDPETSQLINVMLGVSGFDMALLPLAEILKYAGLFERAIKIYNLVLAQYIRDGKKFIDLVFTKIKIRLIQNNQEEVRKEFEFLTKVYQEADMPGVLASVFTHTAALYFLMGDEDKPIKYYEEAKELYLKLNNKYHIKYCTSELEVLKLSSKVRKLTEKWGKKNHLSEVTFVVSSDKGKNWAEIPLHPSIIQFDTADRAIIVKLFPKNISKLIYYFQGLDSSGKITKDDNKGKYFQYKKL